MAGYGYNPDPAEEAARDAIWPDGWFALTLSSELGANAVLSVSGFGRKLVAWRTSDGAAHVANAECPHFGADLSQGAVREDGLTCPIHQVRFDVAGLALPARPGGRAPAMCLRTYPVREEAGVLFVWRHAGSAAPEAFAPYNWAADNSAGTACAIEAAAPAEAFADTVREIGAAGAFRLFVTPVTEESSRLVAIGAAGMAEPTLAEALAGLAAGREA